MNPVFTVGHSNHSAEKFAVLLKRHGIEVLVDIRSRPYSRHAPQFNARGIEATLSGNGIRYLFLGRELGGRPEEEMFYDTEGRVEYALVERSRPFLDGIKRLERKILPVATAGYSSGGLWRSEGLRCGTSGVTVAFRQRVRRTVASRSCSRRRRRAHGSLYDRFHEKVGARVLRSIEGHRHQAPPRRAAEQRVPARRVRPSSRPSVLPGEAL